MKKFICPVCGYVYEGETPPEKCPLCGVPGSQFIEQTGDLKLPPNMSMASMAAL